MIFAIALSLFSSAALAQQIIETKLDLGNPKIIVRDLGTDKFLVKLTLAAKLVSSNGVIEAAQGLSGSAQLGVWARADGGDRFLYLDWSAQQQITADQSGNFDEGFVFSKNQLATLNAPICLSIVVKAQTGAGASKVVCTGQ